MLETRPDRRTLVIFLVLVLIGGTNYVAARISNMELDPFWGAGLRFSAAAVLLLGLTLGRRLTLPRGRALRDTVIYGVLAFFLPYALLYFALVTISAGLAAFVMALVPLLTFFLAAAQGLETFRWHGVGGGLLSVAGIGLMVSGSLGGQASLAALLAILAAAGVAAQASVFAKRVSGAHPIPTNVVGMAVGAVLLLALSLLVGESWAGPRRAATWAALAYLVVLGTSLMFVLFIYVIRSWTASATSYGFVFFPIVASVMGALLAGEALSVTVLGSGAVVLVGVYVGAIYRPAPVRVGPRTCPQPCVGT